MKRKWLGILTVMLLAPITAELLQAYLGDLGGIGGLVFVILFFAPMYGGAALLIREVSVRTGRGWPGRLLMAAGFGVAMTTIIDVSLFTPERDDIDYWDTIMAAVQVGGISWHAGTTWVIGHVLMSVAAPIVIGESLARTPGPWLGRLGLVVVPVGFVLIAGLIHGDQVQSNRVTAGATEYAVSAAIVVLLVATAFTPLGRPLQVRALRAPSPGLCIGIGAVAMAVLDFVPLNAIGLAVYVVTFCVSMWLLARWSADPRWSPRHLAAVTFGAVLARTLTGFLSPLPQDTTMAEKLTQNVSYLALVLLLGVAMWRRTRTEPS